MGLSIKFPLVPVPVWRLTEKCDFFLRREYRQRKLLLAMAAAQAPTATTEKKLTAGSTQGVSVLSSRLIVVSVMLSREPIRPNGDNG